jgi:hypothetical protein
MLEHEERLKSGISCNEEAKIVICIIINSMEPITVHKVSVTTHDHAITMYLSS